MPGKYLTEKERYQIEILLKDGKNQSEIAKLLDRNKSTISREIERGMVTLLSGDTWEYYTIYQADVAQRRYLENRENKTPPLKIGNDYDFVRFVEYWIGEMKYSPQAVLFKIRNENLSFHTSISRQTLYRYIKNGVFLHLTKDNLPCNRKQKKKETEKRVCLHNIKGTSIEERPEEVNLREVFGHWEMDTVVGKKGTKACLLVLSERMGRTEIIRKIPDRKSQSVINALNKLEKELGSRAFQRIFQTITCDNGVEFLDHEGIETGARNKKKKRTKVYYAHPYSSYERGTNENTNRMIRRWIPKGTDIDQYTEEYIAFIQDWINSYPRGIFAGMSADEKRVSA